VRKRREDGERGGIGCGLRLAHFSRLQRDGTQSPRPTYGRRTVTANERTSNIQQRRSAAPGDPPQQNKLRHGPQTQRLR